MIRAVFPMTDEEREAEREMFARILKAVNEPEHFEPPEPEPVSFLPLIVFIAACAIASLGVAAWFVGVIY